MINIVCKNCFSDEELRGFIVSQNIIGNCDCCKSENIEIIELKELYDFFSELLLNFKIVDVGDSIVGKLQSNWGLFSRKDYGNRIFNTVLSNIESDVTNIDDFVDFNDEIIDNIGYWQRLKEQLKWERRYITDISYLTEDLGWDGFFNSKILLQNEDVLYRARLHAAPQKPPYLTGEMSCPPPENATAGRSNPQGIPYLYLSDNERTILYEVRASYLDEVSIGKFRIVNDLDSDVVISDFTETPTLFHPGEVNKRIKITLLKQSISRDLSKPMRRYDSDLDYIPTQFICEFIKVFTNVQGIKFRSSLHPEGNNIVLFDKSLVECFEVVKHQINSFSIRSRVIN